MLGLYFFIVSLDSISFSFLGSVLAPLLAQHTSFFGESASSFWSYVMYGVVIGLFPMVYALSSPVLGALSDRWGRKPVMLACLVMTLLGFISYAFAFYSSSLMLLLFGRVFAGIGCASECIAQAAVMDLVAPAAKPKAVSFIAIAMTMGLLFGPLMASIWAHYSSVYIFSFMMMWIVLAMVLLARAVVPLASAPLTQMPAWRFLWRHADIKRVLLIFLLFELGWSLYFQSVPLMLSVHWEQKHGMVGLISSVIGLALIVCLFTATRVGLRFFSAQQLTRFALYLGVVAFIANIIFPSLVLFVLYALPIVLSVALLYPCLMASLSDLSKDHHGFVIGVAGTLLSFSFALNGFLSSLMMYVDYRLPFLVAGFCWIIALFAVNTLPANARVFR